MISVQGFRDVGFWGIVVDLGLLAGWGCVELWSSRWLSHIWEFPKIRGTLSWDP